MKIILILLLALNLTYAKKEPKIILEYGKNSDKMKALIFEPYKPEHIIGYLNSQRKEAKILRKLYIFSNNKILHKEIIDQLEENKLFKDKVILLTLFKYMEEDNLEKLNNEFTNYKINKIKNKNKKGIFFAIKSATYKNTDKKLYKEYKEKALKYLRNKNQYYYLMYKSMYFQEDYLSAYNYLKYLESIDYYKYIEEELFDICYEGSKKSYDNKDYYRSWYLAKEGMKYINNINYNNNIKKIIEIRDRLFKSNRELIVNSNNKKKDEILYILQTTKEQLIGEKNEKNK